MKCRQRLTTVYCMLYGQQCTGWTTVYCMDNSVLYGQQCTVWTTVYCTDNSVLYGQQCTVRTTVYCMCSRASLRTYQLRWTALFDYVHYTGTVTGCNQCCRQMPENTLVGFQQMFQHACTTVALRSCEMHVTINPFQLEVDWTSLPLG